jgi:vacuolar iron transporter family protein
MIPDPHNRKILQQISEDELKHYRFWVDYTGKETKPSRIKIKLYLLLARILGFTFSLRLMEKGDGFAVRYFAGIA